MEVKMTQRDKLLLIVLVLVIVVFAAVMIPNYGIKDLIVSITDTKKEIGVQKEENNATLQQMAAQGLPVGLASNAAATKRRLETLIVDEKYTAAKIGQTVAPTTAYEVAENWLHPLAYLHAIKGNPQLLQTPLEVKQNTGGFATSQLNLFDHMYPVDEYTCTMVCTAYANNTYTVDMSYASVDTDDDQLAFIIALYTLIAERGSIEINSCVFEAGNTAATLTLSIKVPADSALTQYGGEVCECHTCGKVYTVEQYNALVESASAQDDWDGVIHCTYVGDDGEACAGEWDGIALQ